MTSTATAPTQYTENLFITPAIARKFLEGNVHNRTLKQNKVDQYMAVMRAGKWVLNHQGIAFNIDQVLIDGQHRLYAIWCLGEESATFEGVWMTVTYNAVEEAQSTIDIGATRTASDILTLKRGQAVSNGIVASARMMAGGLRGRRAMLTNIPELEAFIEEHFEALSFAEKLFVNKSARGVSAAGIKAVIARAFYHLPHETLRRFANILITGLAVSGEEAAIMLRNHLKDGMSSYHKNSDNAAQLVYGRTERALEAFNRNKPLSKTPSPIKEELYRLPKEISEAQRLKRVALETKRKEKSKASVSKLKTELTSNITTLKTLKSQKPIVEHVDPKNPKGQRIKHVRKSLVAAAANARS